jgi:hypothetical protein
MKAIVINYRVLRNYVIPFLFFGTRTVYFRYLNPNVDFYPINDAVIYDENKFTRCREADSKR